MEGKRKPLDFFLNKISFKRHCLAAGKQSRSCLVCGEADEFVCSFALL